MLVRDHWFVPLPSCCWSNRKKKWVPEVQYSTDYTVSCGASNFSILTEKSVSVVFIRPQLNIERSACDNHFTLVVIFSVRLLIKPKTVINNNVCFQKTSLIQKRNNERKWQRWKSLECNDNCELGHVTLRFIPISSVTWSDTEWCKDREPHSFVPSEFDDVIMT